MEIIVQNAGDIFWMGIVFGATVRGVRAALFWIRGRGGSIVD